MQVCPACGRENDDDARFCENCGRELAATATAPDTATATTAAAAPSPSRRTTGLSAGPTDAEGRLIADDGLPIGEDLDGEPGGERRLWRGRPSKLFSPRLALMTRYQLSNERLMIEHGFIGRRTEEIDLYRVNDVAVKQNVFERVVGIGDIFIETTDATSPEQRLHNVDDPDRVKDLIRAAARAERQRRRVLLRDEV